MLRFSQDPPIVTGHIVISGIGGLQRTRVTRPVFDTPISILDSHTARTVLAKRHGTARVGRVTAFERGDEGALVCPAKVLEDMVKGHLNLFRSRRAPRQA